MSLSLLLGPLDPKTPYFLATLATSAACAGLLDDLDTAPLRLAIWRDLLNPYLFGFWMIAFILGAAIPSLTTA